MKYKNEEIAQIWGGLIGGEREYNNRLVIWTNHTGSYRVFNDGSVYSYRLLIGEIKEGVKIVYDHTRKGGSYHSKTTTFHVNALKPYSHKIVSYND